MGIYDTLNEPQREAVYQTEGPVLILAGAGSGKTRVLTHRIAYLIQEKNVAPWNILAITFTNKAAGEMRERVDKLIGTGGDSVWVSTFHSTCVRILRRYIDRLGYDNAFSIYDSEDQLTLMRDVCRRMQIDTKIYKEKIMLRTISSAKDELINPQTYYHQAQGDFSKQRIARVYDEYQKQLKLNNALDFDDLIMKTVELLNSCSEVLEYYQNRFQYIMVDEYQDTNTAQFRLIKTLASGHNNLCVVGDDDQSIYKFRGANIQNILSFEKIYPDATVIKLEQNYRSTQNILNAANSVIANNKGRKAKELWTDNKKGEDIRLQQIDNAYEEAEFIVEDIQKKVKLRQAEYYDCAILYRTNAQSRILEERFVRAGIPYKIVGGVNFYSRKEVKDLLAYLKVIDNGKDDLAARRIVNVPKRGIGATSINRVDEYAREHGLGFYEGLRAAGDIMSLGKSAARILRFVNLMQILKSKLSFMSISEILNEIILVTGYVKELEEDGSEEALARIENINELISKIISYETENEEPTLRGFLEEVSLVADVDSLDGESNYVVLMTLHSAKGLEFPHVYLTGMEDGIFPSYMTITSDDPADIEEERRLCYVGITRAKRSLTMTSARQRMVHGETQYNKLSRFIKELPDYILDNANIKERKIDLPNLNKFSKARNLFKEKSYEIKQFTVTKADDLEYEVGDTVKHIKFGTGTVQAIVEGGRDYEVTVDFQRVGVKKMFASFAKLKKITV